MVLNSSCLVSINLNKSVGFCMKWWLRMFKVLFFTYKHRLMQNSLTSLSKIIETKRKIINTLSTHFVGNKSPF